MQSLEPEVEQVLSRIAPEAATQCVGATAEEIARIEKIAGQPLPRFYRWFLRAMGRAMGPLAYPDIDFRASRILTAYADGEVERRPGLLLIGCDDDATMSLHYFYDLSLPARDDARVFRASLSCEGRVEESETLRERIMADVFGRRILSLPQSCDGAFRDDDCNVFGCLDPAMEALGFRQPILSGRYSRIYERADAIMVCEDTPEEEPDKFRPFYFGGKNPKSLKQVLQSVVRETPLGVKTDMWDPPLRNK